MDRTKINLSEENLKEVQEFRYLLSQIATYGKTHALLESTKSRKEKSYKVFEMPFYSRILNAKWTNKTTSKFFF